MSYPRELGDSNENRYGDYDYDDGYGYGNGYGNGYGDRYGDRYDDRHYGCGGCRERRPYRRPPHVRYFRRPYNVLGKKYIPGRSCCSTSFYHR